MQYIFIFLFNYNFKLKNSVKQFFKKYKSDYMPYNKMNYNTTCFFCFSTYNIKNKVLENDCVFWHIIHVDV